MGTIRSFTVWLPGCCSPHFNILSQFVHETQKFTALDAFFVISLLGSFLKPEHCRACRSAQRLRPNLSFNLYLLEDRPALQPCGINVTVNKWKRGGLLLYADDVTLYFWEESV